MEKKKYSPYSDDIEKWGVSSSGNMGKTKYSKMMEWYVLTMYVELKSLGIFGYGSKMQRGWQMNFWACNVITDDTSGFTTEDYPSTW